MDMIFQKDEVWAVGFSLTYKIGAPPAPAKLDVASSDGT